MWPIGSVTQFTKQPGKTRGLRLDLVENGWQFSSGFDQTTMAGKFSTMTDILRAEMAWLADESNLRPTLELWHISERSFGCRLSRPSARTGRTLRIWLFRQPGRDDGPEKQRIGTFEERTLDEAQDFVRHQKQTASLKKAGIVIKKALTLSEALEKYLENKSGNLRDATVKQYRKVWSYLDEQDARAKSRKDPRPFTERTLLHELDSQWWLDEYTRVVRRHGRSSARAFYRVAHAIHAYWVRRERIGRNPLLQLSEDKADELKQPSPSKSIIPAKDLPALWNWLHTKALPATRDLLLVELFSGVRSATAGQLKWSQVNTDVRTYIIPAEERGNKSKTLVEIPICDELWERVFAPRLANRGASAGDWVIASAKRSGQPAKSTRGALEGFLAETGIKVSPHIIRRTFGSLAQQATGDSLLVARMLTHSVNAKDRDSKAPLVTAGYIHYEEDVLRQALNKTAAYILERATKTPEKKAA